MRNPQRRMSELPFLKWYPYLAAGSPRWQSLSLTARGLFHELYDLAARQTPRGTILAQVMQHQFTLMRIAPAKCGVILAQLTERNLITQMLDGTLVFPDWNRHQRDGAFRNRGTDLAHNGRDLEDQDVDVDVDGEKDEEEEKEKTDFDAFWKAYPRKIGKKAAEKAWARAKDKPALEVILAAVKAQAASDQWLKDGGQFIPHPATWLNQGRWSDEPPAPQPQGVPRPSGGPKSFHDAARERSRRDLEEAGEEIARRAKP
jgi:hypothetical protein